MKSWKIETKIYVPFTCETSFYHYSRSPAVCSVRTFRLLFHLFCFDDKRQWIKIKTKSSKAKKKMLILSWKWDSFASRRKLQLTRMNERTLRTKCWCAWKTHVFCLFQIRRLDSWLSRLPMIVVCIISVLLPSFNWRNKTIHWVHWQTKRNV